MAAGKKPRLTAKLRRAPTKYEPKARLAAGGMAEVWRGDAVFEDGGRHPVAIKRVLPELGKQQVYRSMFEDEAPPTARTTTSGDAGKAGDKDYPKLSTVPARPRLTGLDQTKPPCLSGSVH